MSGRGIKLQVLFPIPLPVIPLPKSSRHPPQCYGGRAAYGNGGAPTEAAGSAVVKTSAVVETMADGMAGPADAAGP
jgi:hypothetical protein